MQEIPTCECVAALPLEGKFDAIYCALLSKITNPVDLPTCQCVRGLPLNGKLDAIFCAILQLDGGGGGEITLSQISDLDASWITPLQSPLANFSVTASQISDATAAGLSLITLGVPVNDSVIIISGGSGSANNAEAPALGEFLTFGDAPYTGTVAGAAANDVVNGLITA